MKKKNETLLTNLNSVYIVPIVEKSTQELKKVQCVMVHEGSKMLKAEPLENAELYEPHRFVDQYFQWLIYTKYVTEFVTDDTEKNIV